MSLGLIYIMDGALKYALIASLLLLFCLFCYGRWLDAQAEKAVNRRYKRDAQGVILGLDTLAINQGQPHALVLIPGFMTPVDIFSTLVDDPRIRSGYALYVPRLACHSQDLKQAAALRNEVVLDHLSAYIDHLHKRHQQITYVGYSYGGALLLALLQQGRLPSGAQVILYAPAVYIQSNTLWGNLKVYGYGLFRRYCNYQWLGCDFPAYQSGDEAARSYLAHELNLGYVVIPAVKKLYQLDRRLRPYFKSVAHPVSVVIAEDDNRIDASSVKADCLANPQCNFYSFESGKHLLHRSVHQAEFNALILKLLELNAGS